MTEYELVANDILYFSFYLKEKDPTTGTIGAYNLSSALTITFNVRKYGETSNTISAIMSTLSVPANTTGYCRVLATVPASTGKYYSEVEVKTTNEIITWIGPVYSVTGEI